MLCQRENLKKRAMLKAIIEPNQEGVKQLQQQLGVTAVVAKLLAQRGIEDFDTAKDFFRPQWEHLHDPFLMRDMDKAVARIEQAWERQENIMVYGDYDVDGTTSVALMTSYLKETTTKVTSYSRPIY